MGYQEDKREGRDHRQPAGDTWDPGFYAEHTEGEELGGHMGFRRQPCVACLCFQHRTEAREGTDWGL